MSSIETGSSATSSTGLRMIARAITARCFWPPERSDGYLSRNCSAGASPTRSSASATRRAAASPCRREPVDLQRVADRLLDRHRRVERGVRVLEDDLHPRGGRPAARARCSPAMSRPSNSDAAPPSPARGRAAPAERRLAAARLARRARAPRPSRRSSETPSTAWTAAPVAAEQPVEERAAESSSTSSARGRETSGSAVRAHASSATASSSRSSGSVPPAGISSLRPVQPAERRAGPDRAASRSGREPAHTCIASGQRGWKRQPLGGVDQVGGAPGMECSSGRVERDRRAQQLARVRVLRVGEDVAGPAPPRRSGRRTSPRPGRTPRRRCRGCA